MCFSARIVFATVFAAFAIGCGRKETPVAQPTAERAAPRKVALQTDWFPQAEHGGYYQALAKGFYAQAGLDVQILPGGPGAGIKLKVAKGEADFGMLRSDDIIVASSLGLPFTMVMATMQHDAQALLLHEDSPVKSFTDLHERTVVASPSMTWIPYLEKKYGIKIHIRPNTYGLGEFLANRDTIQQCLVTNEPFFAQQHGKRVRTLALAASGYDCYQAVFCRRELIRMDPDVVRAFVDASIRGWRDYLDGDPAPANAIILKRNAQMTQELLNFSRSEMILRRLVHGDRSKGEGIGQLSLARLSEQVDTLLNLKILQTPVAVSSVATKEFLPPTK